MPFGLEFAEKFSLRKTQRTGLEKKENFALETSS